jgi:hypothetical protein
VNRVRIDDPAVHRIVDRVGGPGAEAAAKFMADQQRRLTRSKRLARAVTHESGKDSRGWYARAGMSSAANQRGPAWFYYFEEFQSGRGGGVPFLRPSLENNTATVRRMLTRGG